MKCYNCNKEIEKTMYCPSCGANQDTFALGSRQRNILLEIYKLNQIQDSVTVADVYSILDNSRESIRTLFGVLSRKGAIVRVARGSYKITEIGIQRLGD